MIPPSFEKRLSMAISSHLTEMDYLIQNLKLEGVSSDSIIVAEEIMKMFLETLGVFNIEATRIVKEGEACH